MNRYRFIIAGIVCTTKTLLNDRHAELYAARLAQDWSLDVGREVFVDWTRVASGLASA